ncbi:eukaryotic translation initiation factor 2-alpha kinase [Cryptococcus neoformans Gb118]|nr:eukaryotic translation initiation factor 2-alpha kinase [Cryptococcus neoformans var. grubii MW-RSA36]OXL05510.1 eukaryotic translation initiation factor 2-alpha kinase [Cryptococcus neoformans var. grubii Gb118]
MSEANKALQEEELESLRAIYPDEWHDIPPTKTAWGTEVDAGWWEVKICAMEDERVSVILKGKMIQAYPHQVPPLLLREPEYLTANHVQQLHRIIQDKAKSKVGEVMIFELIDTVRDFISENHAPLPSPGDVNLMEEKARREEAQRAAEEASRATEAERKKKELDKNNRYLHDQIQLNTIKKKETANNAKYHEEERRRQESLATLDVGDLDKRELELDEAIALDGWEGTWKSWILFGGKRETLWTTYTAEPDRKHNSSQRSDMASFVTASSPNVTVHIVDFANPYYSTALGIKRIEACTVEALRAQGTMSEHVVKVYAVKREKSPKGWERLILVTEGLSDSMKLRSWMPKEGFGEDLSKEYISQALIGLSQLHQRNSCQKQLDLDFTLISTTPNGTKVVKLAGTGYARRIVDLHRSNPFIKNVIQTIPEEWLSPDERDSPHSYTRPRDMWHVGLLLIQMLFGPETLRTYHSFSTLLQHAPRLSDSMTELLTGLLHPNPKKRLTADESLAKLRSFDDVTRRAVRISSAPGHARHQSIPQSPQVLLGVSPVNRSLLNFLPNTPQPLTPRLSRYRADFEEVEFLGKGGFGEVVKARNKLDGRFYAIKKVKLRPEDNEQKVYREVNNLSRVNHQHIVRYYGCWLEDANPPDLTPTLEDSTHAASTTGTGATCSTEEDIFAVNFDDFSLSRRDQSRSASFPRIRFTNSNGDDDDDDSDEGDSSEEDDTESDTESDSSAATADPSEPRGRSHPQSSLFQQGPEARSQRQSIPGKPSASTSVMTSSTSDGMVRRILYIQMEFVEKQTLREAITAGLTDDEVWRLLRQVLSALAHMASLGIVHRDLKPSNILLDGDGNVKIADFGLSTSEMTAIEIASGPIASTIDNIDQTSNIGTSLYIAPEVAISRSYNEKADMYSLGIIFFEMCYPFKTAMERVHILTAVRQPSISFPPGWGPNHKSNEKEIIRRLLAHDPAARFKATELLRSPLLPTPEKRKEDYDAVIFELTDPKSSHYGSLLDTLFDRTSHNIVDVNHRLVDYTYDNDSDDQLQVWLTVVIQRLVDLLQRHGAVETYLPLLIPETTLLDAFPNLDPVRLIEKSGQVVQLPSSDVLAMGRSATRRQIERIKRYHVGRKYTEHQLGGQPVVSGELSFDIVSPIRSAAAEAECLEVVDKVISEFRGMRGTSSVEYEFHVSHETVLDAILGVIPDRPDKPRLRVLEQFRNLSASNSANASAQSRNLLSNVTGLSRMLMDELEQCCIADDFQVVRKRLESIFTSASAKRKLATALDDMTNVINSARACGVARKILFRPTLAKHSEFFRGGFMFECVRKGKQKEVVAYGGRYDSLLEHFKQPAMHSQSRRVFGVGMSIAVDQLARTVSRYESSLSRRLMEKPNEDERSFGYWSPARCDVYVASFPQVDLAHRLQIIGELWRAGIRADFQYDDGRSLEEVAQECQDQNILYLVIPKASRSTIKIRSILRRSEVEVPRNDLCNHLRIVISDQRRIDASYATAEGSIPSAQAAALSVEPKQAEVEIKLILPPEPMSAKGTKGRLVRKHRHGTKSVYYDKASDFATQTQSTLPVLGIDLPPLLICQLTLDTAWITDDEAWRSLLNKEGVHPGDKRYMESIREGVQQMRAGGAGNGGGGGGGGGSGGGGGGGVGSIGRENGWMWLFSVRDNKGFLLQVGHGK